MYYETGNPDEDWMGVSVTDRVLEAISKSRGEYMALIYELWQESVITEEVYLREIKKYDSRQDMGIRIGSPPKPYKATEEDRHKCNHDFRIWPETDGLVQKCTKCHTFRQTPEEDMFWKKKGG